jgi:Fe-S cluster assembly iron-binding protein IscA
VISYTGGTVGAGASCTISLDLRATAVGSLVNTTGDLTSGLGNSGTTTDTLTVTAAPAPGFTKGFASSTIVQGASTSLGFTIDNSSALIEASSLDFTDSLPAGLVVADSPNAASNCTGGTLTATAGSSSISYTGGSVTAAASCQISVDVTAATVGALANTSGDLTSSLGNSGTASDTLTVTAAPAPSFAKSFDDSSVTLGANTTLTFSIDNSTALIAATALDFTDTLPAGLTVASTPNASSTCTGGTLTATAGAGSISYTGGSVSAAASCVIIVDVTTSGSGTLVNTTGDLTSSLGNSGSATASLKVATLGFDSPLSGDDIVNAAEATTVTLSGTTSLIEDGQSVSVSVTDSASGTASGSATVSSDAWSLVIDLSGLSDGSLNLTADVSDAAGTPTPQASASLTLDTDQPALSFDTPLAGDNIVSAAEAGSLTISGGAAGLVDGRSVSLVITDSASATVSGSTTVSSDAWSLVVDLSGLSDGTLSLTADATDAAGNPVDQASTSLELDLNTPSGYSASFDQNSVNSGNEAAASFTFASAEVGALYDYSISSDGGGSPVSGSGTIASASEQITGLDLSGLGDGILTLSVTLTDSAGQAGSAASNTAAKDTSRPTVTLTGPTTAQSSAFVVSLTFDTSVTGLAEADFTIDGGTASGLTGSGTSYSVTVTPDHDGTMTITLPVDSAVSATGNGNEISNVLSVEADLTGTPDPTPPADADGDGIPDNLESSTADRDGDGIVDSADYDPQGYFYCEDNGNILSGGGITVTGPSGSNSSVGISNNINIVRDGSTGEYQWFALVPGSYSVSYSYPATGVASTTRLSSGTLDVTSLLPANPAVLGSTQVGSTGVLADPSLAANPVFYDTFVIEAGDPDVLANNIPMTNCSAVITVSASDNGAEANGAATDSANFTISQTVATTLDSVISYTLTGTATSGADYTAPSGSVTIPAGATSALVDLPVLEDGLIEGDETVILTLTSVTSASAGVALSTTASELTRSATVTDDDFAVIAVTNDDLTATEGGSDTAAMSFVLLGQPTQDVVLSFAGDAQCSVSPAQATFTSANYASAQTLTITAIDDTIVEGTHSCQPTVTVASTDTAFDGFGLALAQVVVTDDLIDQIRTPLTEILKNDLEDTVGSQQRHFSGIAKGALARLQAGEAGLGCGTLASFDVDGSINTQGDTGGSDGTFGYDVYNCGTGSRDILAGSFSLTRTENIGTQALVQFSRQRERFLSESDLRGRFWGGYLSRTNVTGLADGAIHGFGVNGGLYGARQLGDGLFLDYYAAGGFGHHRFDLSFANAGGAIQADGSYDYAAAYAGVALSGRHQRDKLLIIPRVGLDLAYALAGDADVTATQLGLSSTGSIDIPDYNGGRFFAEVEIAGLGSQDGDNPRAISRLMSLTPRVICEVSSYDSGLGCGLGLNFSQELFNPATGLIFSFEIDYESVDDTDRLSVDFHRERRFANGAGAVVTRLSMPSTATLKVEHGLRLDF